VLTPPTQPTSANRTNIFPDTRSSEVMPPRVPWVDLAKGICIILVVYGHVSGGLVDAHILPDQSLAAKAKIIIYTFHMPAFFLLAGLFIPRSARKSPSAFTSDKLRTILYPYILWSALQLIANILLSRYTNFAAHFADLRLIFFRPAAQFWFLYVLFIYLFAAYSLLQWHIPPVAILILGFMLYPFSNWFKAFPWPPLSQIAFFFIFFAAGIFLSKFLLQRPVRLNRPIASITAAACITLVVVLCTVEPGTNLLLLLPCAILGISAVILLSMAIIGTPLDSLLRSLGTCSLEIYLAHVLCAAGLRILLQRVLQIQNPSIYLVGGTAAGVFIPVAIVAISNRLGIPWLFALRKTPFRNPTTSPNESTLAPAT
jgi:fucose 4-O-acetylase-like acetyltransferase